MLGIQLSLSNNDTDLVNACIEEYMEHLPPGKKPIFKLVQKKLKQNNEIVDGMYMRCMEEALFYKGLNERDEDKSISLKNLGHFIEQQRLEFQTSAMARLN